MADEKTCECPARKALARIACPNCTHRIGYPGIREVECRTCELLRAALQLPCPCAALWEENERLKLLDASVEKEIRIKYQDIVYAACNLIDRAMGSPLSVMAERGAFEAAIRTIVSERDSLRAELAAAKADAVRWRKAHDGILAEAERMTGAANAELAASQERERVMREALEEARDHLYTKQDMARVKELAASALAHGKPKEAEVSR